MATYESVMIYSGDKGQVLQMAEGTAAVALEFYENDLVKGDGSGYLRVATAAKMVGIAQARATAVDYTRLEVEMLNPNAVYVIRAKSNEECLQNMVHESWGLNYAAGGHYVTRTTGSKEVLIVGIYPGDKDVAGGRYLVRFNATMFEESG